MIDFMTITLGQLHEMTLERGQRLDNEIRVLQDEVRDALEGRRNAELLFEENETDDNYSTLNEAESKYWDLDDKLDNAMTERDNLRTMIDLFRYVPDCKDIGDIANALTSI